MFIGLILVFEIKLISIPPLKTYTILFKMHQYEYFEEEEENDLPTFGISENNAGFLDEDALDESLWLDEKTFFRAKTAPARPLTEIEEFRKGKIFHFMEQAVVTSTH